MEIRDLKLKNDIYSYIISRKSVRSFDQRPFSTSDLARIQLILKNTNPLIPGSKFSVLFKTTQKGEDLVSILGAYGRFITPRYYLLPFVLGEDQSYVDLGYQVEQIVIQLWSKGIGSCFIGGLSRQGKICIEFHLPDDARVAAFLAIGYPGEKAGIDKITKGAKSILGLRNRMPLEDLCFHNTFEKKFRPDGIWEAILEAGRLAPSAVNVQPWRFVMKDEELYLFAVQNHRKYILPENRFYQLHDCGICMANMTMAIESMGLKGKWTLLEVSTFENIVYPHELLPLAKLTIQE